LNAALEGRYLIERELGEGGMATVYLAEDLRHGRKIALKVLKPELSAVVGEERFLAEIRTTAGLQHPHILPLHDSGSADGLLYYVMPYVEGETLRQRLDREKQLPIDEALRIATAVAGALQAAHDEGIVHRDIKPGNVLLSRGEALVADFGIAIAVGAGGGNRLTETGLSIGTPYYMSPEQATGDQQVGPASDTYSLSAVLYEMLTGDPPYMGSTAQAVLGQIISGAEVSATKARSSVPVHVDAAIRKGLEKLPADRFTRASDFAGALADASFRHGDARGAVVGGGDGSWKAVTGVLVVVLAGVLAMQLVPEPAPPVLKTFLDPHPAGIQASWGSRVAISPDGSTFVVPVAGPGGLPQLGLRTWASLDVTLLPGTEGARNVVFSPDGEWIAFATGTDIVKRPVVGGSTITLAEDADPARVALDWLSDGTIWYEQTVSVDEGFRRVVEISEDGGAVLRLVFASTEEVLVPVWIEALPEGRGALVVSCRGAMVICTVDDANLFLLDEVGREVEVVAEAVSRAWYVPTGHVVYVTADGRVLAREFDVASLELGPSAVPLFDGVRIGIGVADMALGEDGTLLYVTGAGLTSGGSELVWVDREGNAVPVDANAPDQPFAGVELSPDDRTVAATLRRNDASGLRDVWVKELPDGPLQRLTYNGAGEPTWVGQGDSLLYAAFGGRPVAWRIARSGNAPPGDMVLALEDQAVGELEVTPDGAFVAFGYFDLGVGRGSMRIGTLDLSTGQVDQSTLGSDARQRHLDLSPDGRFLAYSSNESGMDQVYVRPFPDLGAGLVQVSAGNSANQPIWSRGTDELFYMGFANDGTPRMMVAEYSIDDGFRVLSRRALFAIGSLQFTEMSQPYDVTRDGQRFLTIAPGRTRGEDIDERLVLVRNWFTELEEILGGN
jgi:serine/threonine-protein kinase